MKGRNATKILLETLLLAAHRTVDRGALQRQRGGTGPTLGTASLSPRCLLEILRTFERAHQVTYSQSPKSATLMKQASTRCVEMCLEGGSVYLVGWQTLGIIAIMDGVECIHTFGADFRDVRGFLIGDHSDMFNQKAELINQGPQFSFSQEDFLTSILPSLTEIDTVVFIFTLDDNLMEVQMLVEQVKEKTANIQALAHSTVGQSLLTPLKKLFPSIISIMWPLLFFEYEGHFIQRETEHEWARGRERGRHRIGNRLQALSHQPRAGRGARTHGPQDRDLAEVGCLTDCASQAPRKISVFLKKIVIIIAIFSLLDSGLHGTLALGPPQDHDLSQGQMHNRLSHPGAPRLLDTGCQSDLKEPALQ
ncbi:glucokinase regulatory protein [Lynx pardinus]|uniref:Glucokinase regulatory protein n=1 Tax=Lynx pardinus TaxID=191816 RepID=A0A485NV87_LYNPA|nr:glucokinase regulatory protein [Lynx pardinus]